MEYIQELRATIRRLHRCEAAHSRTEVVRQVANGRVLWEGKVEVFALLGHDNALRCYAWGDQDDQGRWSVTTVLAIPPVVSAEGAVLAAVAAKMKELEDESGGVGS
ncbi:MAG TPA: hypothetical protein VHE61_03800 [Opitutaceae bacterium]|nr:hypothetical protein [Opitutaceae bacterium]